MTQLKLSNTATSRDFIVDDYRFAITNLPSDTSRVYNLALRHMDVDDPGLRNMLKDSRELLRKHNNSLEETEKAIIKAIKNRLASTQGTSVTKGGITYQYDLQEVQKYLSGIWRPTTANERISYDLVEYNIQRSVRKRDDDGRFIFSNKPIGQGSEDEFNNMKIALDDICRDQYLLEQLSNLENSEDTLRNYITRIGEMAKSIMDLIDQNLYDTKVLRCCTYHLGFI